MIETERNEKGDLSVIHRDISPSVYLDHWAWRKISGDAEWSKRFNAILKGRAGTLTLSWLNLVEYSQVADEKQAGQAEAFLEASMPHVFFIDPEPIAVIQREDEILAGQRGVNAPHSDDKVVTEFLKMFRESGDLLSAGGLFRMMCNESTRSGFGRLADTVVGRIAEMRREFDADSAFQSAVKRPPAGPPISQGTRFVWPELVGTILRDAGTKVTRNHAIDLLHATVPVSYCELVLLDKHWTAQVEKVRSRLKDARLAVPLAKVFSEREDGIERFFRAFEST